MFENKKQQQKTPVLTLFFVNQTSLTEGFLGKPVRLDRIWAIKSMPGFAWCTSKIVEVDLSIIYYLHKIISIVCIYIYIYIQVPIN